MHGFWSTIQNCRQRCLGIYAASRPLFPGISFAAGILFDLLTIKGIDQWSNILILGFYLLVTLVMLALEIVDLEPDTQTPLRLLRAWPYREETIHFCLGSLLSAFTILFFKSSTFWGAFAFLLIIAAALVGNEFRIVRQRGISLRSGLVAICLTSYFACVVPVFWGGIGTTPFLLAMIIASAVFGLMILVATRIASISRAQFGLILTPFVVVICAFMGFYFLGTIPPVPLSIQAIGIYRSVTKDNDSYLVTTLKPEWKIWQKGDQQFAYRPGDRIYCFFSVFSPGGFHERLNIHWLYRHPYHGWQDTDTMAVTIIGGREAGFRGYAYKANIQPGEWQIRIQTEDQREVGRIFVDVFPDNTRQERMFNIKRI